MLRIVMVAVLLISSTSFAYAQYGSVEFSASKYAFWCALVGLAPACTAAVKGRNFLIWWVAGAMFPVAAFPAIVLLKHLAMAALL